jgi:hypothetical protein
VACSVAPISTDAMVQMHIPRHQPIHVEQIVDQLGLELGVALNQSERRLEVTDWLAARENIQPSQDDVHRRAQLVTKRREEFILQATFALRLIARVASALE